MEIKYEMFKKWTEAARNISIQYDHLDPLEVTGLQKIDKSLYIIADRKSDEEADSINERLFELRELLPLLPVYSDIIREVDLNIANIQTRDQVERYLQYLKKELRLTVVFLYGSLRYNEIIENRDVLIPLWNPDDMDIILDLSYMISGKNEDAVPNYLERCVNTVNVFKELLDYIEGELNPDQPLQLNNELEANTHRLLLFHNLGLFEPLFKAHYNVLGAVRFTKLIATVLGISKVSHEGFRPSVADLINSISNQPNNTKINTPAAEKKVNAFLSELGLINNA